MLLGSIYIALLAITCSPANAIPSPSLVSASNIVPTPCASSAGSSESSSCNSNNALPAQPDHSFSTILALEIARIEADTLATLFEVEVWFGWPNSNRGPAFRSISLFFNYHPHSGLLYSVTSQRTWGQWQPLISGNYQPSNAGDYGYPWANVVRKMSLEEAMDLFFDEQETCASFLNLKIRYRSVVPQGARRQVWYIFDCEGRWDRAVIVGVETGEVHVIEWDPNDADGSGAASGD